MSSQTVAYVAMVLSWNCSMTTRLPVERPEWVVVQAHLTH